MKRYGVTILMAVVLAGLAGYLYYVELPSERDRSAKEAEGQKLLPFDEQAITGLTVRTEVGEVTLVPDGNRVWRITAPMALDADAREVEALIRALALGRVTRVVEEKATALAPFGLEKPATVLTVKAGPRQETLSLGESGPISSTLYAMRESDRQVILTSLSAREVLNKTLLTLRKKEVLRVDPGKAERLRLTYPTSEIVLYRTEQPKSAPKPAGGDTKRWKIRYPVEADADQPEAKGLLFKLQDLKALGFVDPGPERDALLRKLTRPEVRITVYAEGAEQSVKLFQLDQATGEAYAVTTPEAPVYRISPLLLKDFTKDLFALQDKRLLGVAPEDIAILAVKTRGVSYVLINQSGTWVMEDQPAEKLDQETAALFVSRVANLPAEIRIVRQTGPLAPYGLNTPAAEFSATTREGKVKGRLVLGNVSGGLAYAMGQGLPGIYQVRSDLLTQVPAKTDFKAKGRQVSGVTAPGEKP